MHDIDVIGRKTADIKDILLVMEREAKTMSVIVKGEKSKYMKKRTVRC